MALILLLLIGLLAGWTGSIVTRTEDKYVIRWQILIALAASVMVGLIVNGGVFLGRIDWLALASAIVACVAALAAYHFFLRSRSGL